MSIISSIINNNTIEQIEATSSPIIAGGSNSVDITIPIPSSNMVISRAIVSMDVVNVINTIVISFNSPITTTFEVTLDAVSGIGSVVTNDLYIENKYNCNLLNVRLSYKDADKFDAGTRLTVKFEGVRTQPNDIAKSDVVGAISDPTLRILRFDNANTKFVDLTNFKSTTAFASSDDYLLIGTNNLLGNAKLQFEIDTPLDAAAIPVFSYWTGGVWQVLQSSEIIYNSTSSKQNLTSALEYSGVIELDTTTARVIEVDSVAANGTITTVNTPHGLSIGTPVRIAATIGNITAGVTYYVRSTGFNAGANTLTLSASSDGSGAAVTGALNANNTTLTVYSNWAASQITTSLAAIEDPLYTYEKEILAGTAYPIGFFNNPSRYWLKIQPTTNVTAKISSIKLIN